MESVIRQVIESEYRAQKMLAEVEEEYRSAADKIELEIRKIKEEIFLSMKQKVEDIKSRNSEYAAAETDRILSGAKGRVSLMQKEFAENKDAWVQSLLDHILGR